MLGLITTLEKLKEELDRMTEELLGLFNADTMPEYKHSRKGYSILPSLNFEEKILGVDDTENLNSEEEENDSEEQEEEINQYVPVYRSPKPDYFGWIIRRVPKHELGYGILGRAFPCMGLIEIAADLYGNDFEEVRTHEILHMQNPEKSELDIRMLTRMSLPFTPRWH